jgi:hypothetical protein
MMRALSHSCVGGQAYSDFPNKSDEDKDEEEFLILWQTEREKEIICELVETEAK